MLGIKHFDSVKTISLILLIIFVIALLLSKNSQAVMRVMVGQEIKLRTAGFSQYQTEHFDIKFTANDEDYVPLIAEVAEDAYVSVSEVFGQQPLRRTTLVVYPDSSTLASSFGWDRDEKAMGVYWAGSIRILSPREWLTGTDIKKQFVEEGPMVHEFAHLMVDEITGGNYNRWWTEGIAQYVEKKITGFEFADPFANGRDLEYYSLSTLGKNFDKLDQQLAYWESLRLAEYIVKEYGEDYLFAINISLGEGNTMAIAIENSLGLAYPDFEQDFYHYVEKY